MVGWIQRFYEGGKVCRVPSAECQVQSGPKYSISLSLLKAREMCVFSVRTILASSCADNRMKQICSLRKLPQL